MVFKNPPLGRPQSKKLRANDEEKTTIEKLCIVTKITTLFREKRLLKVIRGVPGLMWQTDFYLEQNNALV